MSCREESGLVPWLRISWEKPVTSVGPGHQSVLVLQLEVGVHTFVIPSISSRAFVRVASGTPVLSYSAL